MVRKFPEGLCRFYSDMYELVDDPSMDSVISWRKNNKGFVIWNHEELIHRKIIGRFHCRELSEFVSDLEKFGFRRVKKSARLEFTNDNFVRGEVDLLKKMQMKTALTRLWNRERAAKAKAKVEERLQHLQI